MPSGLFAPRHKPCHQAWLNLSRVNHNHACETCEPTCFALVLLEGALCGSVIACELGARANSELVVDPRQIRLDRADGDDELLGHLLVRLALPDERCDALLGRREL